MNRKKILPLAVLAAVVLVLAAVLVLLKTAPQEQSAGIALCDFSADSIDRLSYSGENTDVSLLKGEDGSWLLESDPTLPLEQQSVQSLLEDVAALTADRCLQGDERAGIPERSETPLMEFAIASGTSERTLTVDQANDVADIYYVYDEAGEVYSVPQSQFFGLCKTPRELYAPQKLTQQTSDDITSLQVGDLRFVQTDDVWTLADDPDYPLDQSAVNRMANTLCGVQTSWSITSPEADSTYGLDTPDTTATAVFADGTELTVRWGALTPEDESLCYLSADSAPTVVYEADADYKAVFAVTKESLYDADATAETAAADEGSIIAEHPVGGADDYIDASSAG
ncbi:MAG: DUF4340 domain-containing protein [Blautia massiliensis (ex Durand et al. 2017)]|nr:MAG: hypothetical protein DBX91_10080 [Subdoligranulum variabile]